MDIWTEINALIQENYTVLLLGFALVLAIILSVLVFRRRATRDISDQEPSGQGFSGKDGAEKLEQPDESVDVSAEPEGLGEVEPGIEGEAIASTQDLTEAVVEAALIEAVPVVETVATGSGEETAVEPESFLSRVKKGLSRTGTNFSSGLGNLFLGQKEIDEDLLEDIEAQLLMADVGFDATTEIIDRLTMRVERKQLSSADALYTALKEELAALLHAVESPLSLPEDKKPAVILVVGVNGVGKTTTIGKLAKRLQGEGKKVMLAAGDTFRAAAVEQLQEWGRRNEVDVIAQHQGADSASVIFDAVQSAQSRNADVLIADTAGRLHNKSHLMDELSKVKRVMGKLDPGAPHEVLLVLDAGTGQNALNQAEQFIAAAGVTGIVLTKLDGTAKGGVIFALSKKFGLPVRFIGVGEGIDDLQPFEAETFVSALFDAAED